MSLHTDSTVNIKSQQSQYNLCQSTPQQLSLLFLFFDVLHDFGYGRDGLVQSENLLTPIYPKVPDFFSRDVFEKLFKISFRPLMFKGQAEKLSNLLKDVSIRYSRRGKKIPLGSMSSI